MAQSPAYTHVLWAFSSPNAGLFNSDVVPAGKIWVVRNVTVSLPGQPFQAVAGFLLADSGGFPIFGLGANGGQGNSFYYYEGRQALSAGDNLSFFANLGSIAWRVTGFILSA